jgi:hypothetical protein
MPTTTYGSLSSNAIEIAGKIPDTSESPFVRISAIAYRSPYLVVSDAGDQCVKVFSNFRLIRKIDQHAFSNALQKQKALIASSMCVNGDILAIADKVNQNIKLIRLSSPQGVIFGGSGEHAVRGVSGVSIYDGLIYASGSDQEKITVFDVEGKFLSVLRPTPGPAHIARMRISDEGLLEIYGDGRLFTYDLE